LPSGRLSRLWPGLPHTGSHFLYVDDGGPTSNRISGYQITRQGLVPTPGSPYPTGGDTDGFMANGFNQIATSAINGSCLFHTEDQFGTLQGQVESFSVNPATGALTEVSIIKLPGWSAPGGDVHVSADGKYVYVAQWAQLGGAYYLNALTVGSGCALTLVTHILSAGSFFSIALVGRDGLLGVDTYGGKLDMYRISNGTQLTLASSTPSQIALPLGAAAGRVRRQTDVFSSGGLTISASEAEAHTVNGQGLLGDVPGSPATDSSGIGGEWVWFDPVHQQVIVSEEYSNTPGIFGAKGGALTFLSQAPVVGTGPGPATQLGTVLFVDSSGVNACILAVGSAVCFQALYQQSLGLGIGVL
jgi:hypothetical protein